MSEDESRRVGAQDDDEGREAEAHGRVAAANTEAGDEAAEDDEVEGHGRVASPDDGRVA
jgi:hypothetical protein